MLNIKLVFEAVIFKSVESWHARFNRCVRTSHPNIFTLITHLQREHCNTMTNYILHATDSVTSCELLLAQKRLICLHKSRGKSS